ncbi:zinc finger protein 454 [Drosophila bipectinata]|uniref:zinc finger protein 454 n=1 Tax=Drosophila bipectinata TaxID=42026 RepID=UPI001C898D2A|nr:zinc finger protein 2 [Drosophila bipectinata]
MQLTKFILFVAHLDPAENNAMSSPLGIEDATMGSSMHVEQTVSPECTSQELFFYCESCGKVYEDSESFNRDHTQQSSCCGVFKEEMQFIEEATVEDGAEEILEADAPLWEVVDTPATSAMTEQDETDPSQSERYFCYDCHSIFENRTSAEDHVCPRAELSTTSGPQVSAASAPSPAIRRKVSSTSAKTGTTGTSSISCDICNTVFSSTKFLKFHMRIHEKRGSKSIQDALPVGAHQQYSELDQFYCEICNKSFEENLLAVHKQMHQKAGEAISCNICNRKFDDSVTYQMHLKIHEKPRTVDAVKKPSPSSNGSVEKEKGFACQFCGRVFGRPYEKVKHERVHTGEKPYSCEVCGKNFRVSYSLTLHLRTHTDIRPYVCTICNKRFKSHQVYSHHLKIHSSEREFSCEVCSKTFRTSVQLYAHKNTHTKPYQCAVCNRPFSSMYAVKCHMQTHHAEKGNKSSGAKSSSTSKSTPAGKFWCKICGAEYARVFALRLHMKSAHGITEDADLPQEEVPATDAPGMAETEDSETAVLIAAAEADAAYINAVVNDVGLDGSVPSYQEGDEFVVDNFPSEEIITDWLK